MSSAILYVAIVAIWACVLIPRWLRRDTSASSVTEQAEGDVVVESGVQEEPAPPVSRPAPRPAARPVVRPAARADADPAGPVDPARRRVLSARRRLLLMLIGLSAASGGLAVTKLAAWWVIVPPSVMLLGYLLMLREASKADAEREEMARRQLARAAAAAQRRSAPVAHVAPVARVFTMPAAPEPAEEQIYDQYADAKLRAVGD